MDSKTGYDKVLIELIRDCPTCPWKSRKLQTVPPEGPADSELVIIGRNPGEKEDWKGRPFVGPGGNSLNRFLYTANIDRRKVRITNVSKCYGGIGDPAPTKEVYEACRHWLFAELCLIRPKLIVTLGNDCLRQVTGLPEASALMMEGQLLHFGNTDSKLFVLSHPGYWVRNPPFLKSVIMTTRAEQLKAAVKSLGITGIEPDPNEDLFSILEMED